MSLNFISARSAPIAFACLTLFPCISTRASADIVGFPGLEWSQGSLVVNDQSLPFNGPSEGPSETLTLIGQGGSAELFGSLVPHPAISASVSDSTAFRTSAEVELTYHAAIIGRPGLVNMQVQAVESTNKNAQGGADASLSLSGLADGGTALYEAGFGGLPDNLTIDANLAVQADVIFELQMQINAGAFASGFAQASIDPVFSVPAGYSLEFDPGVGNLASSVPELSTWAMMLLGFAGLGYAGYRRGRAAIAVTPA
jgi:hypothetical protein